MFMVGGLWWFGCVVVVFGVFIVGIWYEEVLDVYVYFVFGLVD